MRSPLVMIYARNMDRTADIYQRYFGLRSRAEVEGAIELSAPDGDPVMLIHQAAKSVKLGQVAVKLVFAVKGVEAFKPKNAALALTFGSTYQVNGYAFANAKDSDKNSISISSRA